MRWMRSGRLAGRLAAALVLLFPALGVTTPADAANRWRELHRPLDLPRIAAGEPCPVSPVDERLDWEALNIFGGSGIGPGPVYPGLGGDGGDLATRGPNADGWFDNKVFWYVKPGYRRRAVVRGRRLDGPGRVRFEGGSVLRPRELRIKRKGEVRSWSGHRPDGSRGVPSGVSVRTAGCYGVQIDGTRFSRVAVFTASTP